MKRHELTDEQWNLVQTLIPRKVADTGRPPRDRRLVLDGIFWILGTGAPWRDLPERYGNWNSQWRRFDRWAKAGRFAALAEVLRDPDLDVLILDSTAVRAHPCAAGAKKSGTGLAARTIRRLVAAAAGSGPRSTAASTALATPASCC